MLEWSEIVLRLGAATLAGGAIGLNRDLRGKPIGLRTLGLVGLATATVVASADGHAGNFDATSRVIQGVLTGIGFLGAGVIIHRKNRSRVQGLTSAACTWLTACIGIICGLGHWRTVIVALGITFAVLLTGGRIERWLHRSLAGEDGAEATPTGEVNRSQSSDAGPHQLGR